MNRLRKPTLRGVACLFATAIASISMLPAFAHADYERAEPAADSVVTQAPAVVRLWFTQDLFRRAGLNRIEVLDGAGLRVDQDDSAIDDDDRRLMTVSLAPDLPDGVYTVRWFSLSAEDGHEGKGEFTFTVDSGGTLQASAAVTTTGEVSEATETTATIIVSHTGTAGPAGGVSPTAHLSTPRAAGEPTATPAIPSSAVPCPGGAAPLAFVAALMLVQRRQR